MYGFYYGQERVSDTLLANISFNVTVEQSQNLIVGLFGMLMVKSSLVKHFGSIEMAYLEENHMIKWMISNNNNNIKRWAHVCAHTGTLKNPFKCVWHGSQTVGQTFFILLALAVLSHTCTCL